MSELEKTTLNQQYFLKELVGRGGMANVYRAYDRLRKVDMAVKVLRRDLSLNARFVEFFKKEAEHLTRLQHPGIVKLYDFNQDRQNGQVIVYIVLEWVEGENMRQRILRLKRPFTLEEVLAILRAICPALDYAHQMNVFHCDVKPANILVNSRTHEVKLTDFGVARHAAESLAGGTPEYMAPEQFPEMRHVGNVTARTDVYGLGATVYEMLSGGYLPYPGNPRVSSAERDLTRATILQNMRANVVPSLRVFNPNLPEAVDSVVRRAITVDPNKRFTSTMHFLEAFERACQAWVQPPPMPPSLPPEPSKAPKPSKSPEPKAEPQPLPPISPPPVQPPKPLPPSHIKGAHLYGWEGEWREQFINIDNLLSIGRNTTNRLILMEPSVSREHAVIYRRRFFGGYFLRDENSAMGVELNGQKIPPSKEVRLRHGDIIRIGYNQVFEFRDHG